jgi:hypothetical protein
MTEETETQEWALREMCERADIDYEYYKDGHCPPSTCTAIRAGAALIAKHEPELAPPEPRPDPLPEAVEAAFLEATGFLITSDEAKEMAEALHATGVTIKVPWEGGDCPLEPGTECLVWFRNGNSVVYPRPEQMHTWRHDPREEKAGYDITAYMVLP